MQEAIDAGGSKYDEAMYVSMQLFLALRVASPMVQVKRNRNAREESGYLFSKLDL
jgi:hypothetical protein